MFDANHKAKLIDFGVSQVSDDQPPSDIVKATEGTYHFMAPEACDPDVDQHSGRAADVWALGITIFCLIYAKCPFMGATEYQIMESIRNDELQIPDASEREVSP